MSVLLTILGLLERVPSHGYDLKRDYDAYFGWGRRDGGLVDALLADLVAGCSLAVAVGGGLVDRKRPFTLLRVSGTPVGVLSRVVLMEAAVPLVSAAIVVAGLAYGTSILAFVRLAPAGTAIPRLGPDYYALMGTGLAVAFAAITVALPLLRRMTSPGSVRFE